MASDLHQRARDLLAKLSITAEGTTTSMDADGAHGAPDSRPPVNVDRLASGRRPLSPSMVDPNAPAAADLHSHWRARFESAWHRPERLYYFVLLAEEDLACVHHPGKRGMLHQPTESEVVAFRGPVAEAAARFRENEVTIRTVRLRNRVDPESGDPWLWPDRDRVASSSAQAVARLKEHALEVARGMLAGGLSQRRVSEATGIPRGTLQRALEGANTPDSKGSL